MSDEISIARPYANAVFEIALANNSLDKWANALSLLSEIAEDQRVQKLLYDPRISWQQRAEFFKFPVCAGNNDIHIDNLIKLLALNKRLQYIPAIYNIFNYLYLKHANIAQAKIISAIELTSKQKEVLQQKLQQRYRCAVEAKYQVDKSLLGGLVIHIKDQVIDASFYNQLTKLQTSLMRG